MSFLAPNHLEVHIDSEVLLLVVDVSINVTKNAYFIKKTKM